MRPQGASFVIGVGRDLLLAVLAFAVALLVLLTLQLGSTERDLRERSLDEAAQYLATHLVANPDGSLRLPVPPGSSWASFGYPAVVFDDAGHVLYKRPASLDPATVEQLAQRRLTAGRKRHRLGWIRFFMADLGEQNLTAAALRTGAGPDQRIIVVFKDENAPDVLVDDVVREFPYHAVQVMLPIFLVLLLAAGIIVWRRMRPVAEVSRLADRIGPETLALRLPENRLPSEVRPIVEAVNGALSRLEIAAGAQREFLRRAAHQLRTPLTVLSARIGLLGDGETAVQLRGDVKELARILTQLLQLDEIDAFRSRTDACADLGAVCEAACDELAAVAAERQLRLKLSRPQPRVLVKGDPNLIEVAVRNLIENALQHSPPQSAVEIRVEADGTIAVDDAGPGVADGLRDAIFGAFWSGDSQGSRSGLGLTIVKRIAERCGAIVTVERAAAGGASFKLRCALAVEPVAAGGVNGDSSLPAGFAHRRQREQLGGVSG